MPKPTSGRLPAGSRTGNLLELVDTRDGHIIVAGDLRPPVIDTDVLDDSPEFRWRKG